MASVDPAALMVEPGTDYVPPVHGEPHMPGGKSWPVTESLC